MRVSFEMDRYNPRRCSKPWGAVVTFTESAKPVYNFDVGSYLGDAEGGTLYIQCSAGDIIAYGQRDFRKRNCSTNLWYIVMQNGNVHKVYKDDAYKYWLTRHSETSQET